MLETDTGSTDTAFFTSFLDRRVAWGSSQTKEIGQPWKRKGKERIEASTNELMHIPDNSEKTIPITDKQNKRQGFI